MSNSYLYALTSGIIGGSVFGILFPQIGTPFLFCTGFLLIVSLCVFFYTGRKYQVFIVCALILGGIGLSIIRLKQESPPLDYYTFGQITTLVGTISDDPYTKNDTTRLTIKEGSVSFIIYTEDTRPITYGDQVSVSGVLEEPADFTTDLGTEFKYKNYLEAKGVYGIVRHAKILSQEETRSHLVMRALFSFKRNIELKYNTLFSGFEPYLLSGIMLGSKQDIPDTLRTQFIQTGTIHIIALSGYNITIVASAIMSVLGRFLSVSFATLGGILGIVLFILMTGAQASAVRAGIMAVCLLLARRTGRPYSATRLLIIAFIIMVLINPKLFLYDVSFQLSFLATIGILYIDPLIRPKLAWMKPYFLRDILSTTLAAQCAVLPFVLYAMGTLSLIAPLVNILILPVIPFLMFLSTLLYAFSLISMGLAIPIAYSVHLVLSYMLLVIEKGSVIPYSSFVFPQMSLLLMLALYGLLGFWMKNQMKKV